MNTIHLLVIVLWLFSSGSVSFTWSSSINSFFTSKALLSGSIGINKNLIETIASGAQMAMDQCTNVFKWDKWNCPETSFSRRRRVTITKEMAYTQSILAAGVVYAITRNCSRGEIEDCGCDPKRGSQIETNATTALSSNPKLLEMIDMKNTKVDWSWGGCSDYPEYGEKIAKNFLDEIERGEDVQAFAHLHNNLVGRQIVRETMVKKCKCHGVSGSCSLQTCWLEIAPFSHIGKRLREKYNKALRIDFEATDGVTLGNSAAKSSSKKIPKCDTTTLVYLNKSPNYCIPDKSTGWLGAKGRSCSKSRSDTTSISEKKSCKNICRSCGHRVKKQKKQISYKCNCKFHWCCEVSCDTCTNTVEEYFCD